LEQETLLEEVVVLGALFVVAARQNWGDALLV